MRLRTGLGVLALVVALAAPTPAAAAPPTTLGPNLLGGDGKPPAQPFADTDVAAGPTQVVQVSGSRLDVRGKAGGVLRTTPFPAFFGLAADAVIRQGRVVYDHRGGGRWVVAAMAEDVATDLDPGGVVTQYDDVALLATSRTSDALGAWTIASHVLASRVTDRERTPTSATTRSTCAWA